MYMYIYIYIYIYMYIYICIINVITCARLRLKEVWRLTKAKTEMKCEHWTKR